MKSNNQANEPLIASKKYSHLPLSTDIMISDLKYLELKYDNLFYWESELLLLIPTSMHKILTTEEHLLQ